MTIVLANVNTNHALMITDRRLTSVRNGIASIVEDEAFKLVMYRNAYQHYVALVGFSGLARAGAFDTLEWLMRTLPVAMSPKTNLSFAITALENAFTDRWAGLAVDRCHKGVIATMCGFYERPDRPATYPFWALISNSVADGARQINEVSPSFRSFSKFVTPPHRRSRYWITTCRGAQNAVERLPREWQAVKRWYRRKNMQSRTKIRLGVDFIRQVADVPHLGAVVGKDCLSASITSKGNLTGDAWYVGDPDKRTVMPHLVTADGSRMSNITVVRL